jgi:hypothetical protein
MEQNPYVSPKEVESSPTITAGMALGVLLLMAIPAGCICGGMTCFSVGIAYDRSSDLANGYYVGWLLGIPIGLAIVVLIPVLAVLFFGKRKNTP